MLEIEQKEIQEKKRKKMYVLFPLENSALIQDLGVVGKNHFALNSSLSDSLFGKNVLNR